jgi:hypothetical protein
VPQDHPAAGVSLLELLPPLEDGDVEARLPQRDCGSQPSDPTSDDERLAHRDANIDQMTRASKTDGRRSTGTWTHFWPSAILARTEVPEG